MRYQQQTPSTPPMMPMQTMQPMQQMPPMAPPAPQASSVPQQTVEQPVMPPFIDCPVPLDKGYRRVAGLYFKDTWQMLLGVTALLLIVFVAVRLATRGYLWGLIFVLIAALAVEAPALRYLPASIVDKLSGKMLVRTVILKGVTVQPASLLALTGLTSKARYALVDDQNRRYFFTADRGLQQSFGDLEGSEVELAFLEKSGLMTGIHPVRRTEYLSVFESARERHLRQVFKDYLP